MGQSERTPMHPDENLLAAFAEQTLAPTERGLVLAHLSDCAACRDAVFLAQQAAGSPALQTPLLFPQERRRSRALRWSWASASAAGLVSAALIAGLMLVHRHASSPRKLPPAQIAASGQPTPSVQMSAESEFKEERSRKSAPARKPALHDRSRTIAAGAEVAGSVLDPSGAAIPGATVSLRLGDATQHQATTDTAGHFAIPSVPPGNYTVNFIAPGFETVARTIDLHPQERAALSEILPVGSASQTVTVSVADAVTPLQVTNSAMVGTIKDNAINGRNSARRLPRTTTFSIKDDVVQRCAGQTCTTRPLPSPSPAVSIAYDGKIAIVVDASGHVFSTADAGEHWVAIEPQWPGKATVLKLTSRQSAGVAQPSAGEQVAPSAFALTNDQGQVWLSSDEGLTWHLQ